MTKTAAAPSREKLLTTIETEIEKLRQCVIASRGDATVEADAMKAVEKLNALYAQDKELFTAEDIRWVNVMRGFLAQRINAHQPKVKHTPKLKRKGDKLAHCWRCETVVDERFTEICPTCSLPKAYQWRTCPVCQACGCQRDGIVLV